MTVIDRSWGLVHHNLTVRQNQLASHSRVHAAAVEYVVASHSRRHVLGRMMVQM